MNKDPFKLSYLSINYREFPDEKTVRCYLQVKDNIFGDIFTFMGEGIAKNGDEYDKEIGEKVSLAKAEIRAYKYYRNFMLNMLIELNERMDKCIKGVSKCERTIVHNVGYLTLF